MSQVQTPRNSQKTFMGSPPGTKKGRHSSGGIHPHCQGLLPRTAPKVLTTWPCCVAGSSPAKQEAEGERVLAREVGCCQVPGQEEVEASVELMVTAGGQNPRQLLRDI